MTLVMYKRARGWVRVGKRPWTWPIRIVSSFGGNYDTTLGPCYGLGHLSSFYYSRILATLCFRFAILAKLWFRIKSGCSGIAVEYGRFLANLWFQPVDKI